MPWGDGRVRPTSPITVINDSRPIESNISTLWQLSTIISHIHWFCFKKNLSFNFDPFWWFCKQNCAWKKSSTVLVQICSIYYYVVRSTYNNANEMYIIIERDYTHISKWFTNTKWHIRFILVTLKGSSDQETMFSSLTTNFLVFFLYI